ncbi:MAG: 2-phospho-L-lactate transferase [Myxococcales bacterium]|nr:2-phospho-L-lactate transferase [Myxococcales bacterium]
MAAASEIVALAGGVGAARFLRGLVKIRDPETITIIGNTGDDRRFYGVHVSPDLDIVTYTLAGLIDRERGYGLEGDGFSVIETLADFGHETWFRLGDRDFAGCLARTLRLADGAQLSEVTDEIRRRLGVGARLIPMSDDPCPTYVELSDGSRVHFEEYLVRDGAPADVKRVDLACAEGAAPAPGVLDAIRRAAHILVCPSNPVVSIGPILALPGVRDALREARAPIVAVSPIVGGAPVKGPADRLLRALGSEVSPVGVAALYRDFANGFVLDERDAERKSEIEASGYTCIALDTLMVDQQRSEAVAGAALDVAASLR